MACPSFWEKRNLSVSNKNKKGRDDGKDDEESDGAPELVEIHEYMYIQTENNDGEPSGKCQLHNVDGEREKRVRKPQQPRRSLRKSQ